MKVKCQVKLKSILCLAGVSSLFAIVVWQGLLPNPDFGRLETFLKAEDWEQADLETRNIIIALATNRNTAWAGLPTLIGEPVYSSGQIELISCPDLLTIDTLWTKYSKNRFGFSVQQKIWSRFYIGITPLGFYESDLSTGQKLANR